jgi:dUTP pyrophosphatase
MDISFVLLDSRAFPPEQARPGDAGFDLRTVDEIVLAPGERASAGTGLAIALPAGTAGLVLPRSGHAARHGVTVVNSPGLIDSGYRGEVRVLLINHGSDEARFEAGDRVAQLLIVDVPKVAFRLVNRLDETQRGSGGFGSTGS